MISQIAPLLSTSTQQPWDLHSQLETATHYPLRRTVNTNTESQLLRFTPLFPSRSSGASIFSFSSFDLLPSHSLLLLPFSCSPILVVPLPLIGTISTLSGSCFNSFPLILLLIFYCPFQISLHLNSTHSYGIEQCASFQFSFLFVFFYYYNFFVTFGAG